MSRRQLGGRRLGKVSSKETIDREVQALELRRAGYSYAEIARAMGLSGKDTVHNIVGRALERCVREPADAVVELETQRLDQLFKAVLPTALTGDPASVNSALRVMERRARLLGLDAPAQVHVQGESSSTLVIIGPFSDASRRAEVEAALAAHPAGAGVLRVEVDRAHIPPPMVEPRELGPAPARESAHG